MTGHLVLQQVEISHHGIYTKLISKLRQETAIHLEFLYQECASQSASPDIEDLQRFQWHPNL